MDEKLRTMEEKMKEADDQRQKAEERQREMEASNGALTRKLDRMMLNEKAEYKTNQECSSSRETEQQTAIATAGLFQEGDHQESQDTTSPVLSK